jgi:hypothetical protein
MAQYTQLVLRNTMNFVASFLKNQPQEINNMDPAVTVGQMVLGTILGPPFKWRQNRVEISFGITDAGTDYARTLASFGFIEAAWLLDGQGNQHALTGALMLTVNADAGRPEKIAPQFDDNGGGITFRFDKTPDRNYTCYVDYQQSAPLLTSPASGWGPVPDYFNYIFNFGYLAIMSLLVNDARFPIFEKYFIGRLLGAQSGLSEQERNIFLANWAAAVATMKKSDMASMAGLGGS